MVVSFYHMTNRYQKQGAIKKLSKLLLRLLILDSFPAISGDFKSIFAFKCPTQKPTARKRGTLITVLNLISAHFLVQSLNFPFFPPNIGAETGRAKRDLLSPARVQPL